MSDDRDPVITRALRDVRVPDHTTGFWERLEAQLDPAPAMAVDVSDVDRSVDETRPIEVLPVPVTGPRRGLRIMAVAAVVVALVGVAITFSSDDGDDERLQTAGAPDASTPPTTSGPVVTGVPFSKEDVGSPGQAVLRWLEAVGAGDAEVAGDITGPRSVAYIEALGGNLDGFLVEAGEGYGGWADVADRSTTEIELMAVGDTSEAITVVVVSGTWKGEGDDGYRTDAFPVTRIGDGPWLVEPFAFDPEEEAGGRRIGIVSPRPSGGEGGFEGMAGDGVLEAIAAGNGTFHFSIDGELTATLPGTRTAGSDVVGASFDPPGELRSGTHLFVIAYKDGNTITALAGTFAVES